MRHYKQLTYTDRLNIEKWRKEGMKPQQIADTLRVHVSTIYRELDRGAYDRLNGQTWEMEAAYSPDIAEQKYQENLRAKGPDLKIGNDYEFARYLETTMTEKECSPAALGYAQNEGKEFKTTVSVPTIYSYIKKGVFGNLTQEDLPRHGKHKGNYQRVGRKKAARAPAGESIEKRPESVKDREEFGHWEMDTVYSAKNTSKESLLMLTERRTREEIIIKLPDRTAESVVKAINALERKWGAAAFRMIFQSITVDNGSEFAAADLIEKSCINKTLPRTKLYFCHPYSSWERGSNENQNGFVRRKHPKGTDFAQVSKAELADTQEWVNNYPRRIFDYKSSEMMFRECLAELGIATA